MRQGGSSARGGSAWVRSGCAGTCSNVSAVERDADVDGVVVVARAAPVVDWGLWVTGVRAAWGGGA